MRIFNKLNYRHLDNSFNVFERIQRNYWFLTVNSVMIGGQILIIFVGGASFYITKLNGPQWALCIICGFICIPWAGILKLIPDSVVDGLLGGCMKANRALVLPVKKKAYSFAWRAIIHHPVLFMIRSGLGTQNHCVD